MEIKKKKKRSVFSQLGITPHNGVWNSSSIPVLTCCFKLYDLDTRIKYTELILCSYIKSWYIKSRLYTGTLLRMLSTTPLKAFHLWILKAGCCPQTWTHFCAIDVFKGCCLHSSQNSKCIWCERFTPYHFHNTTKAYQWSFQMRHERNKAYPAHGIHPCIFQNQKQF